MKHPARHRITATDLAGMGFCELQCLLKARHGEIDTVASTEAKRGGQQEHVRFHREVTQHHNRVRHETATAKRDKRCFIATELYGAMDPRTEQLREFRDRALMPIAIGRLLVTLYYRVSPCIVGVLGRYPGLRRPGRYILDHVRRRIAPRTPCKDASHDREPDR